MTVVQSAVWPNEHLAQSSVPLSVTSFFSLSWAKTAAANRTTAEQTEREMNAFIVGPPEKGSLSATVEPRGCHCVQNLPYVICRAIERHKQGSRNSNRAEKWAGIFPSWRSGAEKHCTQA